MRRRRALVTGIVIAASTALFLGVAIVQSQGRTGVVAAPSAVPVAAPSAGPSQDAALSEGMSPEQGIQAIITNQPTSIDAASAIAMVKKLSPGPARDASSVSAEHVLLTATQVTGPLPGSGLVPTNLPCWMVTFRGLTAMPHGNPRAVVPATGLNFTSFITDDGREIMSTLYKPGS
jgi:hypothetical protein